MSLVMVVSESTHGGMLVQCNLRAKFRIQGKCEWELSWSLDRGTLSRLKLWFWDLEQVTALYSGSSVWDQRAGFAV